MFGIRTIHFAYFIVHLQFVFESLCMAMFGTLFNTCNCSSLS